MELGEKKLFKPSLGLHHTLPQGPTPQVHSWNSKYKFTFLEVDGLDAPQFKKILPVAVFPVPFVHNQ